MSSPVEATVSCVFAIVLVSLFPARLASRWTLAAARTHHGAILPAGPAQWHKITAVELGPYHRPAESSCRLSSPF